MEPRIPDGSLVVCRGGEALAGSRSGSLVVVENTQDLGQRYTIKRYRSIKRQDEDSWSHERIILEPLNPEFEPWDLEEGGPYRVIGIFVRVLE
jgi:SOS-response transcriptional repressor LexA